MSGKDCNCNKPAATAGALLPGALNPYASTVNMGVLAMLAGATATPATAASQRCMVPDGNGGWTEGYIDPTTGLCRAQQPAQANPAGGNGYPALVRCVTPDGKPGLGFPGGPCTACPECVSQANDCEAPGNWNAQITRANLTGQDIDDIIAAFGSENVERTGGSGVVQAVSDAEGNAVTGWFRVTLGSLGVSHTVCFQEVSATNADETDAPVLHMAIQTERFATEDGEGFQVWSHPVTASPDDLETTAEKCACDTLCACVPADGRESFLFKAPSFVIGASAVVRLKVKREDWLTRCEPCIAAGQPLPAVGGRIVLASGNGGTVPSRTLNGTIPFLPT